jgi:predicted dehydrogenase
MSVKHNPNHRTGATITRRDFMGQAAAAAGALSAPIIIPASARGADGHTAPSNRIAIGQIGLGRMGMGHLRHFALKPAVQLVALCDVDRTRREDGKTELHGIYARKIESGTYRGCDTCNDYRELLARNDLDAVVIVTPDHWHTLQTIHAVESGKDVYCEKPVSMSVDEGRQLVNAVQRCQRVFQNGSQYRTHPAIRRACDFIRKGGLGKIKSAFALWGPLGEMLAAPRFKPYAASINPERNGPCMTTLDFALPGAPLPDGLDWDLWLGPALPRPYNPLYHINPSKDVVPWSFCEDFGVGPSTWYHSHAAEVLQYALGYETSGPIEILHPDDKHFPTLTCRYANGELLHLVRAWSEVKSIYHAVPDDARLDGNFGGVVVGERGWLTTMSDNAGITGGPAELMAEYEAPEHNVDLGKKDHHDNWLECIQSRRKPHSHEEIGHRAAALGHLTMIAYKLGRSLKWDPVHELFPEDAPANRLLRRAKRAPWHT